MRKLLLGMVLFSGCCISLYGALSFTANPSMVYNPGAGTWTITFAVSETTDVEVAVVDQADSSIVRHLAAGVLGANPPAPLTPNSLSQSLTWDGKDDFGQSVTGSFTVRVRAGMGVEFDRFAGGNPYSFNDGNNGWWKFNGMSGGDNGEIYISGTLANLQFSCIRAYDKDGDYVRTVFPFRGDYQAAQVSGFGVNNWLNGGYSPKFNYLASPSLTNTILNTWGGYSMLPITGPGEVAVGGGKRLRCLKFNADGTIPSGAAEVGLVTSPAVPSFWTVLGIAYINKSHDPDYVYLSAYHNPAQSSSGHLVMAADTGFWRDGCVYKVNLKTGAAVQFITLDSVPLSVADRLAPLCGGNGGADYFTAIHSVVTDPQGNVLICDRVHQQIGIYDSTGVFLRAITGVPYPDQITIDKNTGALYVACRSGWHYDAKPVILKKFSGWGASDTLVYSATLWNNLGESQVGLIIRHGDDGKPRIWISNGDVFARIYREEGNTVALVRDFSAIKAANLGFGRIGLDRRTETVFINNCLADLFKITDWANPELVRCSTSTKKKLYAGDLAVSRDGQLYVRGNNGFNGPLLRYSLDYYHAPVIFPVTGTNAMTPPGAGYSGFLVYGRMGPGGFGDKGFDVSPVDKQVAFMQMHEFAQYWVDTIAPDGTLDSIHERTQRMERSRLRIGDHGVGEGGVKFDLKGNLYVGATIRSAGHRTPSGFEADNTYLRGGSGSVVRYAPGDTGSIIHTTHTATHSSRIYTSNLGPMSGFGGCQCMSSRFDVDDYGRLFIPSGVTQKVAVVDNNDNPILEFGRYGNYDEQASGSNIPLACPIAAAASDNYIYVNDFLNTRLARIHMTYALENMHLPEAATGGTASNRPAATALTASPNPFNPEVRITLDGSLGRGATLKVFDAAGRLVADLSSRVRNGSAAWNASGRASGMYVLVAEKGGLCMSRKIIYSR